MHQRTYDIHGVRVELTSHAQPPQTLLHALSLHDAPRQQNREVAASKTTVSHTAASGTAAGESIAFQAPDTCRKIHVRISASSGSIGSSDTVRNNSVHRVAVHRETPVFGHFDGQRYALTNQDNSVTGDLHTGRIDVAVRDPAWLANPVFVRTMLPLALLMELSQRGLFYVHGAVVVDPDDCGWILLGAGGAGKSTTAYGLVRQGWRYVCDDGALFRQVDGQVELLGFLREFHLERANAVVPAPELSHPDGWLDDIPSHPHKGLVAMERLYPGRQVTRTVPTYAVGLQPHQERSQTPDAHTLTGALNRSSFLAGMIRDNPLAWVCNPTAHLDAMSRMLKQCMIATVDVGTALADDPEKCLRQAIVRSLRHHTPQGHTAAGT